MSNEQAVEPTSAPAAAIAGNPQHSRPTPAAASGSAVIESDLQGRRLDGLNFAIEKSLRYHQRRRAHFERLHRATMLGVILSGSAAVGVATENAGWLGLLAAVLGALDLVFAFSHRARDHEMLHRRFTDLAISIRTAETITLALLIAAERRRLEIEADEPPVYWALEADCENEVTVAWGRERHGLVGMPWHARLLKHWARFEAPSFRRIPVAV